MKKIVPTIALVLMLLATWSCKQKPNTLFTRLSEGETGVDFRNLLKEDGERFNITSYPYFYNGGGVTTADFNNDGLTDIFFTGNMVKNRLFINKGNLEFEDVSVKSNLFEKQGWCTGTTVVDINNDGWLDIYICRSGLEDPNYRKNLLYINNHDLTFTERAETYGLDDAGYSTQASFFDYDRDNDLDMFLINQSKPEFSRGQVDFIKLKNQPLDSLFRNKLFRNDDGKFNDVSTKAGIHSNVITFSLGVATADINMDGWPDIYVANDFREPDHYYVNNGDGTFTENVRQAMGHNSLYSMGVDVADYNNDLLPDVVVLDMLSEDNKSQKMHMGGDNYTQYKYLFKEGMYFQYMKNSLQKNNGDGTFSEIGQLAGISNTDWSWSPLFADFDNDGLKDLFITNGYKRDNTDVEFVVYSMNESLRLQQGNGALNVSEYISHMPGINLPNYIYRNKGNDRFENKIKDWGLDHNTFSHGAAYADLDNDGDLDLITNNTDDFAGIYRNNSEQMSRNHFIKLKLVSDNGNHFGIGSKIYAYASGQKIYIEQTPVRGYQSSSDPILHAGIGNATVIDSLRIIWPDQSTQVVKNIKADQILPLKHADAKTGYNKRPSFSSVFQIATTPPFSHREVDHNDFLKQFLLPHDYSHHGPHVAKADVNGDGLEDVFVAGAKGQPSEVFAQTKDGAFERIESKAFIVDAQLEVLDAAFADLDNDGDMDLFISAGGYSVESSQAQNHVYFNNGKGAFTRSTNEFHSGPGGTVALHDIDGDGKVDAFIGGFVQSGNFPLSNLSSLLHNNGRGTFEESPFVSAAADAGIISDAVWADIDGDKIEDLVIAAQWKPLQVYYNKDHQLRQAGKDLFAVAGTGLWSSLLVHDFDYDGDNDILAGNYGLNSQLKVNDHHPMQLYYADFDDNGSIDPIITHYIGDQPFPLIPRDDLNGQIPSMKKKFSDYKVYASASINEILSPQQRDKAKVLEVTNLATVYLENNNGKFVSKPLPMEAQYSPVFVCIAGDFNHDGFDDFVLAGNQSYNRIYLGKHDANYGQLYLGDGKGNFKYVPQYESGLSLKGDVKDAVVLTDKIVFSVNGGELQCYRY